jgi:phage replication O-like protein O
MANPQLENGHTRIANEILEKLAYKCPGGAAMQVLLTIIRKTYGWHKKEDTISITQLQEATKLSRRSVIYAVENLEAQHFITVSRQRGRGNINMVNTIAFQKNSDLWVVQRKSPQYQKQLQKQREKYHKGVVQRIEGSAKNEQGVVQRNENDGQFFAPTKDIYTKDNSTNIAPKKTYGEFQNVLLTDEEYGKLKERFNHNSEELIERLSAYLASTGKRYRSHYATILNWKRREHGDNRKRTRTIPETYTPTPDYPDL